MAFSRIVRRNMERAGELVRREFIMTKSRLYKLPNGKFYARSEKGFNELCKNELKGNKVNPFHGNDSGLVSITVWRKPDSSQRL